MQQLLGTVSKDTTSRSRKIGSVLSVTPWARRDGSSVEVRKPSHQLISKAPVFSPHAVAVLNSAAAAAGTCTVCAGSVETFSLTW